MAHSFYLLLFGCALNLFYVPSLIAHPIINGIPDDDHDLKHQVSIHSLGSRTNTLEYICSGTIVSEWHILTAANCFMIMVDGEIKEYHSPSRESTIINAGTNSINGQGVQRNILRVYIPRHYDIGHHKYADIAVALLSKNLGLAHDSHRIQALPFSISSDRDYETNKEALFSGFGLHKLQMAPDGEMRPVRGFSPINLFLKVQILPNSACLNYISQICAKSSVEHPFRVACTGDSGAGLIFEEQIIGVLSNGPPNCDTNMVPMVFTRISFFQKFINEAMNKSGNHRDMHILE